MVGSPFDSRSWEKNRTGKEHPYNPETKWKAWHVCLNGGLCWQVETGGMAHIVLL